MATVWSFDLPSGLSVRTNNTVNAMHTLTGVTMLVTSRPMVSNGDGGDVMLCNVQQLLLVW